MDSTAAPEAKRFRNSQFPLHHTLDNLFGVGEGVGKGTSTFPNVTIIHVCQTNMHDVIIMLYQKLFKVCILIYSILCVTYIHVTVGGAFSFYSINNLCLPR